MLKLRRKMNKKGMTLVEVLVTLAVLSIMAVPIFDTFLESMKINHKTMSTVTANHVGQQVLEKLKSKEIPIGMSIPEQAPPEGVYKIVSGTVEDYSVVATYTAVKDLTYVPNADNKVNLGNQADISSPDVKVLYSKLTDDDESHFEYIGESTDTTWTKLKLIGGDTIGSNVDIKLVTMVKSGDKWEEKSVSISPATPLSGTDDIKVVIQVEGSPDEGRIDVINDSKRDVIIYEVDDKKALIKVFAKTNANKGTAKLYRNVLSEADDGDNQEMVYNVNVTVSKNGSVLEEFAGTIIE